MFQMYADFIFDDMKRFLAGVVGSPSDKGFLFSRERSSSNIIFMKPMVRLGR